LATLTTMVNLKRDDELERTRLARSLAGNEVNPLTGMAEFDSLALRQQEVT
jgi:hypothetical protein